MRKYKAHRKGSPPDEATVLASARINGAQWTLYSVSTRKDWHNIKLCADSAPRKANYRLAWNTAEHRLAGGRETDSLAQRPELYAWVLEVMRAGEDWLDQAIRELES